MVVLLPKALLWAGFFPLLGHRKQPLLCPDDKERIVWAKGIGQY
jgi:hypothetical protein